jgi:hypothetical protein
MTLLRKLNSIFRNYFSRVKKETYLIINFVLAVVILLVFAYSGIFSPDKNNYPVVCIHEKISGEPCFSCGLSHSFSLIVRGRLDEAYQWNVNGIRVFLFFVSQLLMRIVFSFYYLKDGVNRKGLINFDIAGSILIFAIVFYPFIVQLFIDLF